VRLADRLRKKTAQLCLRLCGIGRIEQQCSCGVQERIEQPSEPPECRVVLSDFPLCVEQDPRVDGDGDEGVAEGGGVEGKDCRCGSDVIVCGELRDLVGDGDTDEAQVLRV
jgi:hypothetical protein